MLALTVRNDSTRKGLYHSGELRRLAERVCEGEHFRRNAEVSVLLCDDPFIAGLNRTYRKKQSATDVLSFGQLSDGVPLPNHYAVLGDVVISLETVERRCGEDREASRMEVKFLFCHGLLHLLGWTHETEAHRQRMAAKQAEYLGIPLEQAWRSRGV